MKNIVVNKNDFEIQIVEQEAIFQNKSNGTVHFLNQSALIIFNMLSNGKSVENIIKDFSEKYPDVDFSIIDADCRNTIEDFIKNNIIYILSEDV